MDNRNDHTTAKLIDTVLASHEDRGINGVACILRASGVPLEIAVRVLTRPHDRRSRASGQLSHRQQ
jgi:hypothetical protein